MQYYASNISDEVFQGLEKIVPIKLLESELDLLEVATNKIANDNASMLFQNVTDISLGSVILNPCKNFIEITGSSEINEKLIRNVSDDQTNTVNFSLTAKTIHKLHVSHFIVKCLSRRIRLYESLKDRVATALHESFSNIIISGCYGINSDIENYDGFKDYYEAIDNAVNDTELSLRRVDIKACWDDTQLTVKINYEGNFVNFDSANYGMLKNNYSPAARRVYIIHNFASKVEALEAKNEVTLFFNR